MTEVSWLVYSTVMVLKHVTMNVLVDNNLCHFISLPVPTGLSMKMIEWFLCHEYGFLMSDVSSDSTENGPSSVKSPNSDVDPGPPCSHTKRGAVS
jgi:hypothetical protein